MPVSFDTCKFFRGFSKPATDYGHSLDTPLWMRDTTLISFILRSTDSTAESPTPGTLDAAQIFPQLRVHLCGVSRATRRILDQINFTKKAF